MLNINHQTIPNQRSSNTTGTPLKNKVTTTTSRLEMTEQLKKNPTRALTRSKTTNPKDKHRENKHAIQKTLIRYVKNWGTTRNSSSKKFKTNMTGDKRRTQRRSIKHMRLNPRENTIGQRTIKEQMFHKFYGGSTKQAVEILYRKSSSSRTEKFSFHRPGPVGRTEGMETAKERTQWLEKGHGSTSVKDTRGIHTY